MSDRSPIDLDAPLDAKLEMLGRDYDPPGAEARFTTDEALNGETWSLAEMLEANAASPEVCEAIRALAVGEKWRDIVTVERVS